MEEWPDVAFVAMSPDMLFQSSIPRRLNVANDHVH